LLHIFPGGRKEEDEITLEMMAKFGWWNVRGGSWCAVEMNSCPKALMERQSLVLPPELMRGSSGNACGRNSKVIIGGDFLVDDTETFGAVFEEDNVCFRCGRDSHWARDCFAKTDINGYPL
jgi:hypothetical protein